MRRSIVPRLSLCVPAHHIIAHPPVHKPQLARRHAREAQEQQGELREAAGGSGERDLLHAVGTLLEDRRKDVRDAAVGYLKAIQEGKA